METNAVGAIGKIQGTFREIPDVRTVADDGWILVKTGETIEVPTGVYRISERSRAPFITYAPEPITLSGPLFYASIPATDPRRTAREIIKARVAKENKGFLILEFVPTCLLVIGLLTLVFTNDVLFGLYFTIAAFVARILIQAMNGNREPGLIEAPPFAQVRQVAFSGLDHEKRGEHLFWVPFRMA